MKDYHLNPKRLRPDGDIMAKGHHAPWEFLRSCESGLGITFEPMHVSHEWWRVIPGMGDDGGPGYYWAAENSRGAFPVTTVAAWAIENFGTDLGPFRTPGEQPKQTELVANTADSGANGPEKIFLAGED